MNDLKGLGAYETTQYFRGHLYILVDFLMGFEYQFEDDVDKVISFLNLVIKLIIKWIQILPTLSKQVTYHSLHKCDEAKVHNNLFFVDENHAILACGPEFMDILAKIFCKCHRCLYFYQV
jgi:hypothetical protein